MDKILHDPKDPKLWELWYIPYYGSCRIMSINRSLQPDGIVGPFAEDFGCEAPCGELLGFGILRSWVKAL